MTDLIRSEVLKVRSTQVWLWMILPAVAFTALGTVGTVYDSIHNDYRHGDQINYYSVFTQFGGAAVALLVIGVLGLTTEFRHKTITPTLLATPDRWKLIIGKSISYLVFAVFYSILCIIVNFAIAISWLNAEGAPVSFGHGVTGGVIKTFLSLVITALFGLGLGALIRNQAAGMVIGIIYFTVLDGLLGNVPKVRLVWPYTPGGAASAFTSKGHNDNIPTDIHQIAPLAGGLIFLAWAVLLVVLGGNVSLRRDIS